MAAKPVTRAEVRRVLERAHKAGILEVKVGYRPSGSSVTIGEVARRMRMPPPSLRTYWDVHARRFGWDPRKPETWRDDAPAGPAALDIQERTRYQDEIAKLRKELRVQARGTNADEDLRRACFQLGAASIEPPKWTIAKAPPKGGPGVPVLFTSDFQWGERISREQLDGMNQFNLSIARKRYETLIAKAVELTQSHMVKPNYPGLIYLRGGDMISGEIHQELRETNSAQSIPAVVDLVESETAGLEALLDVFPEIWVISVPGNHGRTTFKPQSKSYVETNYDTLSAWMLEQHFRNEKRIRFYTPASGDALFTIYGYNFCMTHGDRIGSRGGHGFIGPAATIARGMKKVIEYYAGLGRTIDKVLVGHFHTYLELELGFCNGSLPGYSEYARDGRFLPQPPQQLLFFVHPAHGVTARWPILLEKRPRIAGASQAFSFLKSAA